MSCEKCGNLSIVGPRYNPEANKLVYRCSRCGYKWDGPSLDSEKDLERYRKEILEKFNKKIDKLEKANE